MAKIKHQAFAFLYCLPAYYSDQRTTRALLEVIDGFKLSSRGYCVPKFTDPVFNSLHCLPVLSYSDHAPFLRSRVPSSTANGMEMYSAVYRNGTDFKELMRLSTKEAYLPSCFNYYYKPLSLRLTKSEDKTVIAVNTAVQPLQHLYWPVAPPNLLPNYTGTYFCCDVSLSQQCSGAGRPTYKLQVVGESSDPELIE